MVRFSIRRGLKLHKDGQYWTITRRVMDGSIQLETDEGEILHATEAEILAGCSSGAWQVDSSGLTEILPIETRIQRDFTTFSVAVQAGASRRQKYLKRLMVGGLLISTPDTLKGRILDVARELGDSAPPSPISVYRWYRRFKQSMSINELVDRR